MKCGQSLMVNSIGRFGVADEFCAEALHSSGEQPKEICQWNTRAPPEQMVGGASAHLLHKRPAFLAFRTVFTFTGASGENGCGRTVHCIAHAVCHALHARTGSLRLPVESAAFRGVERAAPDLPMKHTGSTLNPPMEQTCSEWSRKTAT